jgi:hypothetical protein
MWPTRSKTGAAPCIIQLRPPAPCPSPGTPSGLPSKKQQKQLDTLYMARVLTKNRIHFEPQQKNKTKHTRTRRGSATHTVHLFALQVTIHVGDRVESITRPQLLVSFTMHLYTTTASLTDKNNDGVSFKGRWWSRWPLAPVKPPPAPAPMQPHRRTRILTFENKRS